MLNEKIARLTINADPDDMVIHIDKNPRNNNISNLRVVNARENVRQ
jgi:hypothetical protein